MSDMASVGAGCAAAVLLVALAGAFSALIGLAAHWVLSHFGVIVPWYVCSVALFILGSLFRAGAK